MDNKKVKNNNLFKGYGTITEPTIKIKSTTKFRKGEMILVDYDNKPSNHYIVISCRKCSNKDKYPLYSITAKLAD